MEIKSENIAGEEYQIINDLVADPLFSKLKIWDRSVNFYEIAGIQETKHSQIISWLLNPREGHGLGDLFIKELLSTCIRTYQNLDEVNGMKWKEKLSDNDNDFFQTTIHEIQEMSFNDTIVETEVPAGKAQPNGSKRPAVDICLFDYKNSIMVVIENKHGSKQRKNQLKDYRNHLHAVFSSLFNKILYVFLDYDEKNPRDLSWIGLGYDWIIEFCENVIEHKLCSQPAHRVIEDYSISLSENDPRHYQCEVASVWLLELANKHKEFIKLLNNKRWLNNHIINLTYEDIAKSINKTKKNNGMTNSLEFKLWSLYQKHWGIFDNLSKSASLVLTKDKLAKDLKLEEDYLESSESYVACTDPEILDSYAIDDNENWPVCVCYYLPKFTEDENGKRQLKNAGKILVEIDKSNLKPNMEDTVKRVINNTKIWSTNWPELLVEHCDEGLDDATLVKKIIKKYRRMQELFLSKIEKPAKFKEIKQRLKRRLKLDDKYFLQYDVEDSDRPYLVVVDPDIKKKYKFKSVDEAGIYVIYYPPDIVRNEKGVNQIANNGLGEISIEISKEYLPVNYTEKIKRIYKEEENSHWREKYLSMRLYDFERNINLDEIVDKMCEKYKEMRRLFLNDKSKE